MTRARLGLLQVDPSGTPHSQSHRPCRQTGNKVQNSHTPAKHSGYPKPSSKGPQCPECVSESANALTLSIPDVKLRLNEKHVDPQGLQQAPRIVKCYKSQVPEVFLYPLSSRMSTYFCRTAIQLHLAITLVSHFANDGVKLVAAAIVIQTSAIYPAGGINLVRGRLDDLHALYPFMRCTTRESSRYVIWGPHCLFSGNSQDLNRSIAFHREALALRVAGCLDSSRYWINLQKDPRPASGTAVMTKT
ncbi:hypothetical protein BD769DRAFT_1741939 [Suillus cothurnatus]|nr:hypothetical protein BD769DRAFT_1741939 [Suillus cothurnatus]